MERITSYDITQLRNTASRNRASGVLDGDRAPAGPGAGRATATASTDERRSRLQLAALERVRRARIALAEAEADIERTIALLEMLGERPAGAGDEEPSLPPGVDAADADRLDQVHADLERARRRSSRRSGGREVLGLEMAERLILDRLGYADYDAFDAARRRQETPVLDFAHLEFAQHELAEAEAAWQALLDGRGPAADAPAGSTPLPVWRGPADAEPSFDEVVGFADDLGVADVPTVDPVALDRDDHGHHGDDLALLEELASPVLDPIEQAPDAAAPGLEAIELGPVGGTEPTGPVDPLEAGVEPGASDAAPAGPGGLALPKRVPRPSPVGGPLPQRVRPDRRAAS